ncbi:MAG: hypothetical protein M3348_06920 [Acidobacteriota bacterium]|nr:hypothetical protein [Acidobacteriota bacterium]
MRFIHRFIPVLALLLTLAATSYAQSARRTVVLIPFDFVAGEKTLPAGAYRVEQVRRDSYTAWEIQSTAGRAGSVVMTSSLQGGAGGDGARLVFRKYGETYVLAQLWAGLDGAGREVAQSRRTRATVESLAGRGRRPETVTVAARAR